MRTFDIPCDARCHGNLFLYNYHTSQSDDSSARATFLAKFSGNRRLRFRGFPPKFAAGSAAALEIALKGDDGAGAFKDN